MKALVRALRAANALMRSAAQSKVVKVNLAVTYACNYRCKTCNIWRLYLEKPELRFLELTLDEYHRLFDENRDVAWVSFTGGEPFLRPDFEELVLLAVERLRGLKILNLVTNGSVPERVERLVRKVLGLRSDLFIFVEISLDGCGPLHDYVRGAPRAYESSLETYRRLNSVDGEGLEVKFEYTLSRFNVGRFKELLSCLRREGLPVSVGDFIITLAHNSPYYRNEEGFNVAPPVAEASRELSWIRKALPKLSPTCIVTSTYLKLASKFFNGWRPPCVAGSHSCFINPFGKVYPCITVRYELGDLRRDGFSLRRIFSGSKASFFRDKLRPKCPTCWTPCEAYQSILLKPHAFLPYLFS
ncbi:MAG: hypothetical protein DRJ97_07105 [Thermoprotei archaeon]|nr:MAG: hypothetical protein DRJ97_07105 [Thermoprotei archaeon]